MSNQNAESLDVSAKTVEEAIEQGLAQLNLSQDEVHIKILKEGRRGVFGLGAEEAEVRLTRKQEKPAAAGEPPSEAGISPGIISKGEACHSKPIADLALLFRDLSLATSTPCELLSVDLARR